MKLLLENVISACCNLSKSLRKSISGSRVDYGCDALFFTVFHKGGVKVIIKICVNFVVVCI